MDKDFEYEEFMRFMNSITNQQSESSAVDKMIVDPDDIEGFLYDHNMIEQEIQMQDDLEGLVYNQPEAASIDELMAWVKEL